MFFMYYLTMHKNMLNVTVIQNKRNVPITSQQQLIRDAPYVSHVAASIMSCRRLLLALLLSQAYIARFTYTRGLKVLQLYTDTQKISWSDTTN